VAEDDLRPPEEPRTAASAAALKTDGNSNSKLWLLLGSVVTALILVVLVLPAMVADSDSALSSAKVESPAMEAVAESAGDGNPEQYRQEAEQALQKFLHTQAHPDLNNAQIWSADEWHAAMALASNGDKEFGRGGFFNALQAYKEAGSGLQSILDNREQRLQLNLQTGWQQLQANALEEASAAFERVVAMQADQAEALLGLERTSVRAQVLEHVTQARQAEMTNSLQLAARSYGLALQLDPLYSAAREALLEVEAELRKQAFQQAMGRALQALDNEQFSVAEIALNEANRIFPGDSAISDVRERLVAARRQARLSSLRKVAEASVAREEWNAATDQYRDALSIDGQAAFARNGLALAQRKQQLHRQLDHYLADTTRLYSDDPLENAQKLLAANQQTPAGEPLLAQKLKKLQQAVALAGIPVELMIVSDNLTLVTIYKVGRLGSFSQKQLSLRPGKYTLTGSRKGYRDVHKVIELKPGMDRQSISVLAKEPI